MMAIVCSDGIEECNQIIHENMTIRKRNTDDDEGGTLTKYFRNTLLYSK